jgi:sensor histidine kinase YesM
VARDVGVHTACGVAVAVLKALLERAARTWWFGAAPYVLPGTVALHFLIYWVVVGLAIAAVFYRRSRQRELHASQLETRLSEARLDLLRRQLQPHFLFNSMNAIAELIHENPDRADRMLSGLSDLLRESLHASGRQKVPLRDEIALTRRYLDLHAERLGERLRVRIDVPDECLDLAVPHFVLQPLVENAVVHGIAPAESGGWVRVAATRHTDSLVLTVEDSGEGLGGVDVAHGVGLSNTRARLDGLFGTRAVLAVRPRPGGGAIATIQLPIEHGS